MRSTARFSIMFFCMCLAAQPAHARGAGTSRFVVTGCWHYGLCDQGDYERAVKRIKQFDPDFVIFLGGMVEVPSDGSIGTVWREFGRLADSIGVPVYDVGSDCRYSALSVSGEIKQSSDKYFLERNTNRQFRFKHNDDIFIGLDSERVFSARAEGSLDERCADFLRRSFADTAGCRNIFIFTNRSFWLDTGANQWERLVHPLLGDKVTAVFGAGKHYFETTRIGNIPYITNGNPPCAAIIPEKISPFGFLLVETKGDAVDIKFVPIKQVAVEQVGLADVEPITLESLSGYGRVKGTVDFPRPSSPVLIRGYELSSGERIAILQPDRVVEAMNIRPGMSIADIGAGSGLFTFRFAEALGDTGRVYATDVLKKRIELLAGAAHVSGYKNIAPVLVTADGVDPFYAGQSFDIAFLCGVYDSLLHPADYFRALRPSIKKGSGRLFIIHAKLVPDFHPVEFSGFGAVMSTLAERGGDFPVYQRLSAENRAFVSQWRGIDVPARVQESLARDFSAMLEDRSLWNDLSDYYAFRDEDEYGRTVLLSRILNGNEVELAKWLIVNLDERGVFSSPARVLAGPDRRDLRKLNRMLLNNIFRNNVLPEITTLRICVEKSSIVASLKAAGYRLIKDHAFLSHYHFLEFARER